MRRRQGEEKAWLPKGKKSTAAHPDQPKEKRQEALHLPHNPFTPGEIYIIAHLIEFRGRWDVWPPSCLPELTGTSPSLARGWKRSTPNLKGRIGENPQWYGDRVSRGIDATSIGFGLL